MDKSPTTESRAIGAPHIDALSAADIVERMLEVDAAIVGAVARQRAPIARLIETVANAFTHGGRLIYVGAGTSGRLGVLDASECPPTFGVEPGQVVALIAGGDRALKESIEGAEDDIDAAVFDLHAIQPPVSAHDVVVGIAASGRTPYTLAALDEAQRLGARTALLCCNAVPEYPDRIIIAVETGAEVVAGSTRLKAGTATKLVLNMISTGAMARAGRVYEGYMVGVRPINVKLRKRAIGIVAKLTGRAPEDAEAFLDQADGSIPTATLMARKGLTRQEAESQLKAKGSLRAALD